MAGAARVSGLPGGPASSGPGRAGVPGRHNRKIIRAAKYYYFKFETAGSPKMRPTRLGASVPRFFMLASVSLCSGGLYG